jgi:hypothetical protein
VVLSFKGSLARSSGSGGVDVRQGFRSCERLTGMRWLAVDPPTSRDHSITRLQVIFTSSPSFRTREVDRQTPSCTEKLLESGVLWDVAKVSGHWTDEDDGEYRGGNWFQDDGMMK